MNARASTASAEVSSLENNRRTVEAYEGYARRYALAVSSDPDQVGAAALVGFLDALDRRGKVLEIGSGPGWDADYLEERGLSVRRTDVTRAFREIQAERGHEVHALDLLTDPLNGPWDAILMLYVLQHIAREETDRVLAKISQALRPGGVFLMSFREGAGEVWERSERSGDYWVVERSWPEVEQILRAHGLAPTWHHAFVGSEGAWRILIARRAA